MIPVFFFFKHELSSVTVHIPREEASGGLGTVIVRNDSNGYLIISCANWSRGSFGAQLAVAIQS